MGTNYYWHEEPCQHCGRTDEPLHIGKSSAGWTFGLHIYPDDLIFDLPDWKQKFEVEGSIIKNEYGETLSAGEMIERITNRSWNGTFDRTPEYLRQNHAEIGPNNLMRRTVDRYCIGHGEGTWDLMDCEFS